MSGSIVCKKLSQNEVREFLIMALAIPFAEKDDSKKSKKLTALCLGAFGEEFKAFKPPKSAIEMCKFKDPDKLQLFENKAKEELDGKTSTIKVLSDTARTYFAVSISNEPVLLVGINAENDRVNISSVAKITNKDGRSGIACMKKLIEDEIIPYAVKSGKKYIQTYTITDYGKKFFKNLGNNLPIDIEIDDKETHGEDGSFVYRIK